MDPDQELIERQPIKGAHEGYTQVSEPSKALIAIRKSRGRALASCWIHVAPVGLSFVILQLSFRRVYWEDVGGPAQNSKLGGLQVVAKLHEVLIMLSLSHLVLHYVRKGLLTADGVPFGLLEGSFRIALGAQPFSYGLWTTLKGAVSPSDWSTHPSFLKLLFLVLVAATLGLTVGPASAIAVIPKLRWWYTQDMFQLWSTSSDHTIQISDFSMYIPKQLFPRDVTASSLPGSFCLDASQDINFTCPSAGFGNVLSTLDQYSTDGFHTGYVQNVSIGTDTPRRMELYARRPGNETYETSSASIVNFVLADYMALAQGGTFALDIGTPYTIEVRAGGSSPLSPIVSAECHVNTTKQYNRTYSVQVNGGEPEGVEVSGYFHFDVRDVWNESILAKPEKTRFAWRDVTQNEDHPVLLGLVLQPEDARGIANLTLCAIQSSWIGRDQWIYSTMGADLVTNFTWWYHFNTYSPIHVHEDWAEALNGRNGTSDATIMETLLDRGFHHVSNTSGSYPSFINTVSDLLSKALADGLSRIGSEFRVNGLNLTMASNGFPHSAKDVLICKCSWCSQGPFWIGRSPPQIWNATYYDFCYWYNPSTCTDVNNASNLPIMRSFPRPSDFHENWTEISFPVFRYGYGYSFEGITVYLASAVLIFHAALVVGHVIHRVVFDAKVYSFADSLAELLTLAMGNQAPTGPGRWKIRTTVQAFHDADDNEHLKLVAKEQPMVEDKGRESSEVELNDLPGVASPETHHVSRPTSPESSRLSMD